MTKAQEDGYVECTECGHEVEIHNLTGCTAFELMVDQCGCPARWTQAEIRQLRLREGLPARWKRTTI